jgi:hypothetical protein
LATAAIAFHPHGCQTRRIIATENSGIFRQNPADRMADDDRKGSEKGPHVDITVSDKLYEYLGFLARHTVLGRKEVDVARAVLTRRLEQMLEEKYHEKHAVPEEPKDGKGRGSN